MDKLGDMSHATSYSAYLKGWLSMQHVPRVVEIRNVLYSPRKICVSLATNFANYKVSKVAKLEKSWGHATRDNVARDMSPSLARP